MLTMDLLRHGALQGGVKYRGHVDDPLTLEGRSRMDKAWAEIKGNINLIISSPLSRCAEPALDWARQSDIECIIEPRVREMYYGDWEGKTIPEIQQQYPGILEQWRSNPEGMRPPGGESPEELRQRIAEWWTETCIEYDERQILLVSHSGALRMLIAHILAAPIASTRHLEMPYACRSRLSYHNGKNSLLFHNSNPLASE
ncbi:alpha-ribazole phosphatase [Mariprofundus micogutta]|uniref:Alpha-ribazole phosphatase n=1 Tax=Mariprofundus micogutta TaxID=1921010 RepID=A0A1L8CQJ1_9PROT|nr:histidine phosphatase family protein [Mariprofundus micogutta]GAV21089.1 alpha-ribazole phosphatase [Mariprofundus micogutta]